jgi:2-dehydropantoate 2-reductase
MSEASDTGVAFDLALLTVKAYDTAEVITELRAATSFSPPILTLQNGIGNEEALAEAFGPERVLAGAIDTPVSVPQPGQVQVHRARYDIGLAAWSGETPAMAPAAAALTGAGFTVRRFPDARGLKWTKLLMNLLANAQCAIVGWTPAQVMSDPIAAELEARAWQEAIVVMRALDIRAVSLGGYPLGAFLPVAAQLPPRVLARVLQRFVVGGRGTKLPSLRLALEAGNSLEVDWLNGAVARYGQRVGVHSAVNDTLTQTLHELAEGRAPLEAFRGQPRQLAARVAEAANVPIRR